MKFEACTDFVRLRAQQRMMPRAVLVMANSMATTINDTANAFHTRGGKSTSSLADSWWMDETGVWQTLTDKGHTTSSLSVTVMVDVTTEKTLMVPGLQTCVCWMVLVPADVTKFEKGFPIYVGTHSSFKYARNKLATIRNQTPSHRNTHAHTVLIVNIINNCGNNQPHKLKAFSWMPSLGPSLASRIYT